MDELATLVAIAPPPFIFIHDPNSFQTSADAVINLLDSIACSNDNTAHLRTVAANGISCFTPRLLYDRIINSLANWTVKWEEGCSNWSLTSDPASSTRRWNDSFDGFVHGLRALHHSIRTSRAQQVKKKGDDKNKRKGKGKGKQKETEEDRAVNQQVRFVIVVEHAGHLRENMPDFLVPLTRLAELTQLDLVVIFLSQVRWEDMKPSSGASPDPYFIDIPSPKKEEIVSQLEEHFGSIMRTTSDFSHADPSILPKANRKKNAAPTGVSGQPLPGPYHPSLRQLYSHFTSILCDVCYPFTHDPREIQYIAAARWPGFVQPVLAGHAQRIERLRTRLATRAGADHETNYMDVDEDYDEDEGEDESEELRPPTEDTRLRLSRLFKPTLTSALEELYPRLANAAAWAQLNSAPPDPDSITLSRPSSPLKMGAAAALSDTNTVQMPVTPRTNRVLRSSVQNTPHTPYTPRTPRVTYAHNYSGDTKDVTTTLGLSMLPRLSKFILIAAFIASTNPSKSDIRMFGRGLDEKKRKRRRTASTTGSKTGSGPSKVPQRLLGPTPFPLDRLIAILGALLEENDITEEIRLSTDELFNVPGEYTDMEISRVGVYTTIGELSSIWLLHRTSPPERLEGPPMFKCGISYDDALGLAKELDVPLNDLLWDPL
ncbi:Origin recognition complex (ORC) subunit 5 C-terminus domain containing protein [Amanita muscaria]